MANNSRKKPPKGLWSRHMEALVYVLGVLLPIFIRTRRRPVIFARHSGMGDIICTIPAARELMKRHPGSHFIYNCHSDFAAIPRLAGVADRLTSLESIGLVGHWYRFMLSGFYQFSHGDDSPTSGCHEPMVTEFLRQFGLPLSEEHSPLTVSTAARERALSVFSRANLSLDKLVLLHPGPSWPVREWPGEYWAQFAVKLREHGIKNIAQLGVGRYLNFGKVDVQQIPGVVSLIDALDLEECVAAIAQAKLFVGIDSGLLHIAAAMRTPSVGIFAATLPEYRFSSSFRKDFIFNPVECAGCEHRKPQLHWITNCPYDIKCMKTIKVEEVLDVSLRKLEAVTA